MRRAEIARMFELEDTYWWFVARRQLVDDLLTRYGPSRPRLSILDVGCGTGATLQLLGRFGDVTGLDQSPDALRYCRRRGSYRLVRARAESLPVASGSVDVITALDLLEHVHDDAEAAREFSRALRPDGLLLVTVPACPQLWSEHDEALDHLRRYRAARLRFVLSQAGLQVERLSPLITALLAPIAALRLVQRLRLRRKQHRQTAFIIPPRPVNWLLTTLLRAERWWLTRLDLPLGVSLMAVARKRRDTCRG